MRWRLASFVLVWGLGGAGCSDPYALGLPSTELVYESEGLRIHAEGSMLPCAGVGPSMDRALGFFSREFGLSDVDEIIDVYWLTEASLSETSTSCGRVEGARGCLAGDGLVLVLYLPTEHELVHAYFANRAPGRAHSFFEEGIAVVYGRDPVFDGATSDLREALQQGARLEGKHYARAGHFTSFLLDEYGPEQVGRFLVALVGTRDLAGVEPIFRESFGITLDEFIQKYEAEAPACGSAGWNRTSDCESESESEPLSWRQPWAWEHELSLDCSSADVVQGYDGWIHRRAALEVGQSPTHTLFLDDLGVPEGFANAYRVQLLSCGGCEEEVSFTLEGVPSSVSMLVLEPGRYYVDVSREPEAPPDISVRLRTP